MEGPSTRRCSRCVGESFLGFRETFSSKSMFLVRMTPRSIQWYRVDVLGIRSLENLFVLIARPTTISGDQSCFNIFLSRSEEHTSELQSRGHLVCRLLLAKKNTD